jgi:uncharacterized protein (TIGR01244 family)
MEDAKKVSEKFSVAGQLTPEDLKQASQAGFKSVLNLRSSSEANSLPDEQQQAEAVGLEYANVPLQPSVAEGSSVSKALEQLEALPKPVLIHCGAGLRAGAIAMIATAKEQNWTLEQLTEKATEIGLNLNQAHIQQFIQETYRDQDR